MIKHNEVNPPSISVRPRDKDQVRQYSETELITTRMEAHLLASKIVSMLILGLASWIIGLVPMVAVKRGWLNRKESEGSPKMAKILSCLMCFGGGVIMTSSLAHMLPDVTEVFVESVENGTFPDTGKLLQGY